MKNKIILTAVAFAAFFTACKKQSAQENQLADSMKKDCNCTMELAMPDIKGEVVSLGSGTKTLQLIKKDGQYIMGGDIILSDAQVAYLKHKYAPAGVSTESTYIDELSKRWTDGIVYYTIDPSLSNQKRVTDAIAYWTAKTNLTFTKRTTESNYIKFVSGSGCSSSVGMVGGAQRLTLGSGCSTGNAIHEIGHALGLLHEQSRADRDNYIIVNTDNIQAGYEGNFMTYTDRGLTGGESGAFDFGSIMMYDSYSFSSNGQPTMTKLDGSTFGRQRDSLSTGDLAGFAYLYPNYTK